MTASSDRRASVREYLLSQGEKYSYTQLWPRCVKARLQLLDSLQDVGDEQAGFKPSAEEWSIVEVAVHLLKSSKGVLRLVASLADGLTASTDEVEPPREETDLKVGDLHRQLVEDAIAWTALTQQLPEPPSFEVTAHHMFFGELHSRAWYLFQRIHDLDHVGQIAQIKESPGYPGGSVRA